MDADWTSTPIDGVVRGHLATHADERGAFRELWRNSATRAVTGEAFVQANLSRSTAGVLRGVHFHLRQADLWIVLEGTVHVGLVDVRPSLAGSAAPSRPPTLEVALGEGDCLLIPAGVAHGFWALSATSLLYLVSNEYDGSDEHGFAWDDPAVALGWPGGAPILSGRDANAPSLAEAVARAVAQARLSGTR